jgi:hypothetical protein
MTKARLEVSILILYGGSDEPAWAQRPSAESSRAEAK